MKRKESKARCRRRPAPRFDLTPITQDQELRSWDYGWSANLEVALDNWGDFEDILAAAYAAGMDKTALRRCGDAVEIKVSPRHWRLGEEWPKGRNIRALLRRRKAQNRLLEGAPIDVDALNSINWANRGRLRWRRWARSPYCLRPIHISWV